MFADEFCTNERLNQLIYEINGHILAQGFKLKLVRCETTGSEKLILQNEIADDISKAQDRFSAAELNYFQLVLQEIITADACALQTIACINLTNSPAVTIKKDDAEKLLSVWQRIGYLVVKDRYIHLGPRCIAEFTPYFQTHCKDYVNLCGLCNEIVFSVSLSFIPTC